MVMTSAFLVLKDLSRSYLMMVARKIDYKVSVMSMGMVKKVRSTNEEFILSALLGVTGFEERKPDEEASESVEN
jgi:hypothetical protein